MGKLQDYKLVTLNNGVSVCDAGTAACERAGIYAVSSIYHKGKKYPIILNKKDFDIIHKLNKNWSVSENGSLVAPHVNDNGETIEIYMHEIVMALKNRDLGHETTHMANYPIIHINKLGIDNRRDNLMFDTENKPANKNLRKKARTITLPKESGINPEEIPTYIWYLKPSDTHGERFVVEIGDTRWKTTSSNSLSLRYKLEEAKKYTRELKQNRPELFSEYSMNGEFNKKGKELLESFYEICQKAGYRNVIKLDNDNLTDKYLKPKTLNMTKQERELLESRVFFNTKRNNKTYNMPPKESNIKMSSLPKNTYYVPANSRHGDYFVYQDGGSICFITNKSKLVSTQEKYRELIGYCKTKI